MQVGAIDYARGVRRDYSPGAPLEGDPCGSSFAQIVDICHGVKFGSGKLLEICHRDGPSASHGRAIAEGPEDYRR